MDKKLNKELEMVRKGICLKCKSKLVDISNDEIVGVHCTNCNYGYVADSIKPWQEDETIYSVYFSKSNNLPFNDMKFIAKKLQTSVLKIKDIISKEKILYLKGKAWELKDSIIELNKNGIEYEIDHYLNISLINCL